MHQALNLRLCHIKVIKAALGFNLSRPGQNQKLPYKIKSLTRRFLTKCHQMERQQKYQIGINGMISTSISIRGGDTQGRVF